jgi:hypothetical protein
MGCGPGVGGNQRGKDLREACNADVFPVLPATFDENGAHRHLGRNGSTDIGDALHFA